MPTARVYQIADLFRQQILQRERSAASAMVRYYGTVWESMQEEKSRIIRDLMSRRDAWERTLTDGSSEGTQDAAETLYQLKAHELARLRQWQSQVERELNKFSEYASADIQAQKRSAIIMGQRAAEAMINASFPTQAGITATHMHMNPGAIEALVAQVADGTPLDAVIRKYVGDAAQGVKDTLVRGMTSGWGADKLARELRQSFGMGLTNALRLARTEQLRAYRTANHQTYRDNDDVLDGWVWIARKGPNVCAACMMMDGTIHPLSETLDDHPNGACCAAPHTKSFEELGIDAPEPQYQPETGREWFEQQSEETQRRILGKSKYGAWKAGALKLEDIPAYRSNDIWGGSWVPKSNMELFGAHTFILEEATDAETATEA